MQITRFPNLTASQFEGCIAAFVDSLFGELNAAAMYLRKLENRPKGAAFAYEMSIDTHRYGALMVLDRWSSLVQAFGPALEQHRDVIDRTPERVAAAEDLLGRVNRVIDAADSYSSEVVEAGILAFQTLQSTFAAEREIAQRTALLGAMLPDDYRQARRIFLEDLAAR